MKENNARGINHKLYLKKNKKIILILINFFKRIFLQN